MAERFNEEIRLGGIRQSEMEYVPEELPDRQRTDRWHEDVFYPINNILNTAISKPLDRVKIAEDLEAAAKIIREMEN